MDIKEKQGFLDEYEELCKKHNIMLSANTSGELFLNKYYESEIKDLREFELNTRKEQ